MSYEFVKVKNETKLRPDYIQLVVVVVMWKGQVLLIHRETQPFKGLYSIPGGHVEQGETYEEAARRELDEETHIRADKLMSLVAFLDHEHRMECHGFLFLSEDGVFLSPDSEEQEVIGWKTFSEAAELSLTPGLRELFDYIEASLTS